MTEQQPMYVPLSIQDVTDYSPTEGTIRAKRVNYKLQDGTVSYVVIPLSDYTVERVHEELHRAAEHHHKIMSIRPGYSPVNTTNEPNPWG